MLRSFAIFEHYPHLIHFRATTEQCPFAIIVMSLQSILGVIIQACMAGIIFAKFTVPRNRGETIVFSKNAVITIRNGSLYLVSKIYSTISDEINAIKSSVMLTFSFNVSFIWSMMKSFISRCKISKG